MGNCAAGYVEQCVKGKSQIWSVRHVGGMRLATLETRIQTAPEGRGTLHVVQHKGVSNQAAPETARTAVQAHVARLSSAQEQVREYLDWKQTISLQPLEARQRHALMLPIVTAMEQTLSGQWSWQRLLAMGGASVPPTPAGDPR